HLETWDAGGPRARGDDEPLRLVPLAAHLDLVGADEARLAREELDLVALEEHRDAARHLLDHARLERVHLLKVDLRLAEAHAEALRLAAVPDLGGHVQERFRGDAPHVQAHAADVALLGASNLEP